MRKSIKRVLSVALAATVAVSGVAYTGTKASAASSYKAVMGYADTNGNRKLYKKRYEDKIDNVSALMDAFVAYKVNKDAFE